MDPSLAQHHPARFKRPEQWLQGIVTAIGGYTIPGYHQSEFVEEETPLPTDAPAMMRFAFLASLVGATPVTQRLDHFNSLGINNPNDGGFGQEPLGPLAMSFRSSPNRGAEVVKRANSLA